MNRKQIYTLDELAQRLELSQATIRQYLRGGKLGLAESTGVPGEYLLEERVVEKYIADQRAEKERKAREKAQKKPKKKEFSTKTHFVVFKYSPEEWEREARRITDQWFERYPEQLKDLSPEEAEALKKRKYEEHLAMVKWTFRGILKEKRAPHATMREVFELPHDLCALAALKMKPNDAEYFINQLIAYKEKNYDLEDPTVRHIIVNMIREALRMNKRQDQLALLADNIEDDWLTKDLAEAQKRYLELTSYLGEAKRGAGVRESEEKKAHKRDGDYDPALDKEEMR